jgi:hypothetical protein
MFRFGSAIEHNSMLGLILPHNTFSPWRPSIKGVLCQGEFKRNAKGFQKQESARINKWKNRFVSALGLYLFLGLAILKMHHLCFAQLFPSTTELSEAFITPFLTKLTNFQTIPKCIISLVSRLLKAARHYSRFTWMRRYSEVANQQCKCPASRAVFAPLGAKSFRDFSQRIHNNMNYLLLIYSKKNIQCPYSGPPKSY